MSDETESIDCDSRRRRDGTATRTATEEKRPVGRTNAAGQASQAAYEEAWAAAMGFRCPKDCPELKLRIRLHEPDGEGCTPGVYQIRGQMRDGFECKASCTWELLVRCGKDLIPEEAPHPIGDQRLKCKGDDEIADGLGTAGPVTATGPTRSDAGRAALEALRAAVKNTVIREALHVTCPDGCFPQMWIVVGKPTVTFAAPAPPATDWSCTAKCNWYVEVRCRPED